MDVFLQPYIRGTVRIVDDDAGFRDALKRILDSVGLEVICYSSATDCLMGESFEAPGCMLLDIYMPGPSGLDLWGLLTDRQLHLPTIFMSGRGDVPTSVRTMKEGAIDFLTKPVETPRLLESIRRALHVDAIQRAEALKIQSLIKKYETLEGVERMVFSGIVSGKLNKQLAGELDRCERTIKTYRAQVMSKLNVETLPELVRVACLLKRSSRNVE